MGSPHVLRFLGAKGTLGWMDRQTQEAVEYMDSGALTLNYPGVLQRFRGSALLRWGSPGTSPSTSRSTRL